jgi:hypothetical protein
MIQGRRKLRARVRGLTRTQGKVVVGIGASRQGSSLLVSCAVTRDQLHRQVAMGPGGMHDGQSVGATAIKEDPVRGISARLHEWLRCINMQADWPLTVARTSRPTILPSFQSSTISACMPSGGLTGTLALQGASRAMGPA